MSWKESGGCLCVSVLALTQFFCLDQVLVYGSHFWKLYLSAGRAGASSGRGLATAWKGLIFWHSLCSGLTQLGNCLFPSLMLCRRWGRLCRFSLYSSISYLASGCRYIPFHSRWRSSSHQWAQVVTRIRTGLLGCWYCCCGRVACRWRPWLR